MQEGPVHCEEVPSLSRWQASASLDDDLEDEITLLCQSNLSHGRKQGPLFSVAVCPSFAQGTSQGCSGLLSPACILLTPHTLSTLPTRIAGAYQRWIEFYFLHLLRKSHDRPQSVAQADLASMILLPQALRCQDIFYNEIKSASVFCYSNGK